MNYSLFPNVHILNHKKDPKFGTICFDKDALRSYDDLIKSKREADKIGIFINGKFLKSIKKVVKNLIEEMRNC